MPEAERHSPHFKKKCSRIVGDDTCDKPCLKNYRKNIRFHSLQSSSQFVIGTRDSSRTCILTRQVLTNEDLRTKCCCQSSKRGITAQQRASMRTLRRHELDNWLR